MPQSSKAEISMRLVIDHPVPGVLYSLQDRSGKPVDAQRSMSGEPILFEFPVRASPGPKFYGEQVRNGGEERRFIYVAVGQQAGDPAACWDRRMKIDIHTIPQTLVNTAVSGGWLEGTVGGTGTDGSPACATVRARSWRAV